MDVRAKLRKGLAIPAHPLALTAERKLDERRQRALTRYYMAANSGGVAVGVHTTQFAIREVGLLRPVLEITAEELRPSDLVRIAGVCGGLQQALGEAELARGLGYDAVLLSLAAASDPIDHARAVAEVIPVVGFYLQPDVGGRVLPYEFWREFASIENVVAIKIAPFHRYRTLDVVRAVCDSGRAGEIALYTGNDDNIIADLLTEFRFGEARVRIVGGLLGHWSVWTQKAVQHLQFAQGEPSSELLTLGAQITDANAALFDVANRFHGCIAGLHEILRRQGLLEGRWCLDPKEDLSTGQLEQIDRVWRAYPHLNDDAFVQEHRDSWLR